MSPSISVLATVLFVSLVVPNAKAVGQISAAPAQSTPTAPADAHREAALKVIRLGYGAEVLRVGTVRLFSETLPAAFAADPGMGEMEAAYPGITAKVIQSFEADMVPLIVQRLPQLWDRLVPVYTRNLTIADLDRMHAYYDSEAGRYFILETARNIDLRAAIDKALASDGKSSSIDELAAQASSQAETYIIQSMSEAELDAFLEMVRAVGEAKFDRNNDDSEIIKTSWFEELTPDAIALLETRLAKTINNRTSKPAN